MPSQIKARKRRIELTEYQWRCVLIALRDRESVLARAAERLASSALQRHSAREERIDVQQIKRTITDRL